MAAYQNASLQSKSAENQGWQAELMRAFKTLSAIDIVDHGFIDDSDDELTSPQFFFIEPGLRAAR